MKCYPSFLILALFSCTMFAQGDRPNVLFIAVDDLRPELSSYGQSQIISPHIDRLAASGTRFERAYCMVPTCGASRASLFSGRRPTPDRFVRFTAKIDEDSPNTTTLHSQFKNNGYETYSLGKILHFPDDQSEGWTESPWRPNRDDPNIHAEIKGWNNPSNLEELIEQSRNKRLPFASFDVDDNDLGDGKTASEAVRRIHALAQKDSLSFLRWVSSNLTSFQCAQKVLGSLRQCPHRPPGKLLRTAGAPDEAIHNFGELRNYAAVPKTGPVSNEMARTLIRGYYACVSYTDAQEVGRLLDALDATGLSENTIVVLWGDHGWNLGEHTLWCKHCTFETSMRAPLIIRTPDKFNQEKAIQPKRWPNS